MQQRWSRQSHDAFLEIKMVEIPLWSLSASSEFGRILKPVDEQYR